MTPFQPSNPTQMSPIEFITKPLIIVSTGLLMDHSKNTIGMDLIIDFFLIIFSECYLPEERVTCFFDQVPRMQLHWNAPPLPVQLYFTCKVFANS
jgi:hypothetical protein